MKDIFPVHLEGILSNLPTSPGVYQMKDTKGEVLYVGKAKNLKSRVNSYFARTEDLNLAKRQMVGKIYDIQVTLTSSEVEALILETNLIKHLRPKYNILMKDDKNLAYIKITNSPIPELIKTRQKIRDGGEYFGPYVSSVEQSVRALRRIFRIRNCRMKFARTRDTAHIEITDKAGKSIPCMDYYIGLCPAPCLLESEKVSAHTQHIDRVRTFLRGESATLFSDLEIEMQTYAKELDFEKAQETKEIIQSLRTLHERQRVRDLSGGDMDIIVAYEKYERYFIGLTQVRGGQIISLFRYELTTKLAATPDEMFLEFLALQYVTDDGNQDFPDTIILPSPLEDEGFLEFLRLRKIALEVPKSGPKNELLAFTLNQLREYAYKSELATLENRVLTRQYMVNILEKLGYGVPKKGEIVFECYDISHTNGQFTVASRAVIVNGKPDPTRYRKYNIKSLPYVGKIDDFASHREVMLRRTLEGYEQGNFPHLIIIDGGKGQLSSAISGIREGYWKHESSLKNHTIQELTGKGDIAIPSVMPGLPINPENNESFLARFLPAQEGQMPSICSIAKREEEIFLPGQKNPVLFEKGTGELMLLQKARDESHRFAITANRSARMKSMKKNILEELPGFGPVTRKKLLKLAGSIDAVKNLTPDELSTICTKAQIETLRDHGII